VDTLRVSKFTHKLGKIFRLRVLRKHSIVHHGQSTAEEVTEFPNLDGSILELNDTTGAIFICPEVTIILLGKSKRDFDSQIYPLLFGGSIQKRTYKKHKEETTQREKGYEEYKRSGKIKVAYQPYLDLHQSSSQAYNSRVEQLVRHWQSQIPSIQEPHVLVEGQLVHDLKIYEIGP
jgi:hypothetical protein